CRCPAPGGRSAGGAGTRPAPRPGRTAPAPGGSSGPGVAEGAAGRFQGAGDLLIAMRAGEEAGLEGGRCEVDATLEQAVEEAAIGGGVAGHGLGEGLDLLAGEEQAEHGAAAVAGVGNAGFGGGGFQAVAEFVRA